MQRQIFQVGDRPVRNDESSKMFVIEANDELLTFARKGSLTVANLSGFDLVENQYVLASYADNMWIVTKSGALNHGAK